MKFSWLLLLLSFSPPLLAQGRPVGSRNSGLVPNTVTAPPEMTTGAPGAAFLSGNVTIEGGGELTEAAVIDLICHSERHIAAYTDHKGGFSFQFADPNAGAAGDLSDASSTITTRSSSVQNVRDWRDCQVQAELAGYSSPVIELASRMSNLESVDLGTIVLHRMDQVEGTSISVTSLAAPAAAKKAFAKAQEDEQKGKWADAQKRLQKAVQIYPKYAVAWYELGKVQMRQNDLLSARNSFEQSVAADSKYVNSYDGLAQLEFQSKQWPQVVETTDKLIAPNPLNFPVAYLFSGVAHYYQGDIDGAEKITRRGVEVDEARHVPKLRYLLGVILMRKHDYAHASEQIQQYISMTKQPAEIQEAKKQLAEIERLSSAASSSEKP